MSTPKPTVDHVTVTYPPGQDYLKPGQSAQIIITGTSWVELAGDGTASNGDGSMTVPFTVTVAIQDPDGPTFTLTFPKGTVVPAGPGQFVYTAP